MIEPIVQEEAEEHREKEIRTIQLLQRTKHTDHIDIQIYSLSHNLYASETSVALACVVERCSGQEHGFLSRPRGHSS